MISEKKPYIVRLSVIVNAVDKGVAETIITELMKSEKIHACTIVDVRTLEEMMRDFGRSR